MKLVMLSAILALNLSACSHTHTGGFFGASNSGTAGGVTQSFRW
ncbi:hypothetical protein [Neisseria yangbaofengii]|nr:hypothetical protein [Neisseria yangbaofengii]